GGVVLGRAAATVIYRWTDGLYSIGYGPTVVWAPPSTGELCDRNPYGHGSIGREVGRLHLALSRGKFVEASAGTEFDGSLRGHAGQPPRKQPGPVCPERRRLGIIGIWAVHFAD